MRDERRARLAAPHAALVRPAADRSGRRDEVWAWTFAKSQKARNLERDARASLQVETGREYQELRGILLECDVVLHRDLATVTGIGLDVFARYTGAGAGDTPAPEVEAMVRRQAAKRAACSSSSGGGRPGTTASSAPACTSRASGHRPSGPRPHGPRVAGRPGPPPGRPGHGGQACGGRAPGGRKPAPGGGPTPVRRKSGAKAWTSVRSGA